MARLATDDDSRLISPLRAWYASSIETFLAAPTETIIGALALGADFSVLPEQRDAWLVQVELLSQVLVGFRGTLFFEFSIPRMGRRIDAVVQVGPVVFVLEFKVGAATFDRSAMDQVWDYALDLKNFHETSEQLAIVPVLVATEANISIREEPEIDVDRVFRPLAVGSRGLRTVMEQCIRRVSGDPVDGIIWARGVYRPSPTIIEAARTLYAQHSVEAITRNDAGADNLRVTSRRIEAIIDRAMAQREKVLCLVTGVPGAGKTLVGLNIATRHRRELEQPAHAVYLSGNGPLVAVLREALARDQVIRRREAGESVRRSQVAESVKAFIQNVHHFRDDALVETGPPIEHVVIFDEAQRAWNLQRTAYFMRRRKKIATFSQSEPEFLISCVDRHNDWAVIVCLIGGGQEINTGEAGIGAWLEAAEAKFPHWRLVISSRLTDSEYGAAPFLASAEKMTRVELDDSLHLAISIRSFRAENVSAFVKALLDCELEAAQSHFGRLSPHYPIVLTRDLQRAKNWVRAQARGTERFGLLASSGAQRLKPHAIDVRVDVDPIKWFLNPREDTRSSFYLEDAATEFHVQGLELDWSCVTWDGDLRYSGSGWSYHDFHGSQWRNIAKPDKRTYLRNAYRVLLTRARQGMIIFIPRGDADDPTRSPAYYDRTFDYLARIGLPQIG